MFKFIVRTILSVLFWQTSIGHVDITRSSSTFNLIIPMQKLRQNPVYNSGNRYDNNDRNTSAAYDLWDKADLHLFEWPGNVTVLDPNFPLLKWNHDRARLLRSPCEKERGMELAVYSYKYLHLTWAANRLTRAYCHPLRMDRKKLPVEDRAKRHVEVGVVDFDFVFDALLVVMEDGYVMRVGDIEINYRRALGRPHRNLSYSVAEGISRKVNRVISQKCCSKAKNSCTHGDAVVAFQEASSESIIFISYNGGKNFQQLSLQAPTNKGILQAVLFYPNWKMLIGLHRANNTVYLGKYKSSDGALMNFDKANVTTKGFVQASRIGNEMAFLIWDDCKVWYSQITDEGLLATPAAFYLHDKILTHIGEKPRGAKGKHVIRSEHCYLGRTSSFQLGDDEGKLGFLDQNNVFFYGVDLKTNDFKLIGLNTDMSLLLPQKKNSVVLGFDRNNRPKLLYPPRYLRLPSKQLMDSNYKKRLAMRIVPKTLFPSDFMEPFYEENLEKILPAHRRHLALAKCQTSSISINGAISQKPKMFTVSNHAIASFYITFEAYMGSNYRLRFEPDIVTSIFDVHVIKTHEEKVGTNKWLKFGLNITLRNNYFDTFENQESFLVNFLTQKSLRCVHQPQFPVWIKIDSKHEIPRGNKVNPTSPPETKAKPCRAEKQHVSIQQCSLANDFDEKFADVCSGLENNGIYTV